MKNKIANIILFIFIFSGIINFSQIYPKIKKEQKLLPLNHVSNKNTKITAEKAKEIALKHAKVLKSNARFRKIKLDIEHGILVYEMEFIVGNAEYEYEIDANNGSIVSYEIEW